MSSRKIVTLLAIPTVKNVSKTGLLKTANFSPLFSSTNLSRSLNTHALSPTVTLLSNQGHIKHLRNRPDLSQYSSEGRPLSILLCWLMAKNNAVKKYAKFYLDNGYDVLTVRITPLQLLLPSKVEPIVRDEILPILLSSDHERKLVHGFSVGGYVFARMLKYMQEHPQGSELMKTFKAQIWDSVVDVNGVSIGVSKSVFGNKNPALQQGLEKYIDFHMKAFYNIATKYYFDAHHSFYKRPLHSPALFFCSEADQISTMDVVQDVQRHWKEQGITCDNQIWKNTAHVGHMRAHPTEYTTVLRNFLQKSGAQPEASRGRVTEPRHLDHGTEREESSIPQGIPNVVYSKAV